MHPRVKEMFCSALLCSAVGFKRSEMTEVSHQQWGEVAGLGAVEIWVLQSSQVRVEVVTLGAIIRSVWSKGKDGQMEDVTLGFNDVEGRKIVVFLYIDHIKKNQRE